MNESIDHLSIVLIATISVGTFMLSLVIVKYRGQLEKHIILFLIGLTLLWIQVEFLSIRLPFQVSSSVFYGTRHGVWLLLGPLYYIYTRSAMGENMLRPGTIVHFLPAIIFAFVIPVAVDEFLSSRQIDYGMLTVFDPFNDNVTLFQYVYSIVFLVQFIHLLGYSLMTYIFLVQYEMEMKQNFSALDSENLKWSKTLIIFVMLGVCVVSAYLAMMFIGMYYNQNADYLYVIPVSLLVYLLAYKLAGVEWRHVPKESAVKYEKSSLRGEQALEYAERIESYVREHKPFLMPDLRLQDLSKMVDIPPHHLSQVLNENLNTSFFDYINRYRVEQSKELIRKRTNSSVLEIAFECGFNNKTSFANAFKKFTGETATGYRKRVVRPPTPKGENM